MDNTIYGLWLLAALLGLYMLPTIIAFNRKVSSPWSIVVINVLLGWTLIGWAVALALAARTVAPAHPHETSR